MPETSTERRELAADARERGEYVGFLACSDGPGRLVKVAMTSQRQRIRAACPHCDGEHETSSAMSRPRKRGEECDVTLPDDPTAKPASGRKLTNISDDEFLAVIPAVDTPAQLIAKTLAVTGSATGTRIRTRAEWLNYDAGAERIVITRQGAPNPTLLRQGEAAPDPDPTKLRGRQQVSDAAILDAVPDQDTPAAEVSTVLGYHKAQALIARMRRMNARAETKGEPPPFGIERVLEPGRPYVIRRAAT